MVELLRDVKKIFHAGNVQVSSVDGLKQFVEEPCLAACQDLYNKNILTYWSSSNQDSPNYSFILLRYEFLDITNKQIADKLVKDNVLRIDHGHESWNSDSGQYGAGVCLGVETNLDMRVTDISQKLCDLASNFVYQDIKYNIYTPQYLMEQFPFYRGNKTAYCFPDLKMAAGVSLENQNSFNSPEYKKYNAVRFLSNGQIPTKQCMQKVADILGWIYNAHNGLIYKDNETLGRHNRYLEFQKAKILAKQNNRNL